MDAIVEWKVISAPFAGWRISHTPLLPSREQDRGSSKWLIIFVCFTSPCKIHEIASDNAFYIIRQIPVDSDRTVVALYKFIKKHATIPFKLQKPASSTTTSESPEAKVGGNVESKNEKDELWKLHSSVTLSSLLFF